MNKIPNTNTAIVITCLIIEGIVIILNTLQGKPITADLYGIMTFLTIIIITVLAHSGVKFPKGFKWS